MTSRFQPSLSVASELTSIAERRIGRVIRRKWRLDKVLAVAGFAAVYEATAGTGQRIAVKILHPELAVYPEVRARFRRESKLAAMVEHPGAASVLYDDEEDGLVFLVMELLEGETLEDRLERDGVLGWEEVLNIADDVLDILVVAHAKGMIHRDIKPANVFVTRRGEIKLLDFGIARIREVQSVSCATQTGVLLGTPAFMSPEQARGRWNLVEARSDLWGLGATMFALLTGRHVHGDLTPLEALVAAMTEHAPPIRAIAPQLPSEVGELIDRALAYEKEDRWADAQTMQLGVRDAKRSQLYRAAEMTVELRSPPSADSDPQGPSSLASSTASQVVAASRMHPAREHRHAMIAAVALLAVGIVTAGRACSWIAPENAQAAAVLQPIVGAAMHQIVSAKSTDPTILREDAVTMVPSATPVPRKRSTGLRYR